MGYMTYGLTFNVLREANIRRLSVFKNKHGEWAHSEVDGSDWSLAQWYEAMSGECGEYANLHKKFVRGDIKEEEFKQKAAKELADVQIYLDLLAFRLGIDLGEAVVAKFNEVSERVDAPIALVACGEDWGYRRQGTEEECRRISQLLAKLGR